MLAGMTDTTARAPRKRMSAEDRRVDIARRVVPAIREHGHTVSTRQLAEAAGVSEGMLFKAYDTKNDVLKASFEQLFRDALHTPIVEDGDPPSSLEGVVTALVEHATETFRGLFSFMAAMPREVMTEPSEEEHRAFHAAFDRWTDLLEPHAAELAISPEQAASFVRAVVFATAQPAYSGYELDITTAQTVRLILGGLRR